MKEYRIGKDEDGHWYLIPNEHWNEFDDYLDWAEDDESDEPWSGFDYEDLKRVKES